MAKCWKEIIKPELKSIRKELKAEAIKTAGRLALAAHGMMEDGVITDKEFGDFKITAKDQARNMNVELLKRMYGLTTGAAEALNIMAVRAVVKSGQDVELLGEEDDSADLDAALED